MKTALISLLSGQLIPNILLPRDLEKRGHPIDMHVVITTQRMKQEQKTEIYRNVLAIPENRLIELTVKEDSIKDITEKIATVLPWEQYHAIVNFTGGTKIMSMAIVENFRNKNAEFFYLPIGKNRIDRLDIQKGIISSRKNIEYRISIEDYLSSYGIEITHQDTSPTDIKKIRWMQQNFLNHSEELDSLLEELREIKRNIKKRKELNTETANRLTKIGWKWQPDAPNILTKKEIAFLTGGWLEDLVFYELNNTNPNLLLNQQLARNIQIKRENANNELDIIFIKNNSIHTIECKSLLKKIFLDETLYKIAALKKDFGLSTKSHLMVGRLHADLTNENGTPNQRFQKRTNVLNIHSLILAKDGIEKLREIIL